MGFGVSSRHVLTCKAAAVQSTNLPGAYDLCDKCNLPPPPGFITISAPFRWPHISSIKSAAAAFHSSTTAPPAPSVHTARQMKTPLTWWTQDGIGQTYAYEPSSSNQTVLLLYKPLSIFLCHYRNELEIIKKKGGTKKKNHTCHQWLTYTPVHLMDSVSIDTMATRSSERRRSKHGGVHLQEGEKQQERRRWISADTEDDFSDAI